MPEQARADLDGMFQGYMNDAGMQSEKAYFNGIVLVPANQGLDRLRHQFSKPLLIVMAIVGVVLLIGCANVANLLLARATARQSEISVRLAIGASRDRLVRQMLTEGALLVSLGAGFGILFARWGVAILVSFFAGVRNRILLDPHFDLRVLAFTAAVAAITGLLFSLAPALHATRAGAAKPHLRLGQALVVVQVALSLTLLCGAALFVRTLYNLSSLDAGFYREGVLSMRVDATLPDGVERARIAHMWDDLIARLSSLPGVKSAAAATLSPMSDRDRGVGIVVAGEPPRPGRDRSIHLNQVTPGYFDTVGIRLLAGRLFTLHDQPNSLKVAILNDTAARFYFREANPIGRKVSFNQKTDEYEVAGVVRDAKYQDLRKAAARMIYLPIEQPLDRINGVMVAIRGPMDTRNLVPAIRNAVRLAVPGGFVTNIATIGQQVDESLLQERLISMLSSFFGALALGLASIGLYGVMSYAVVRRTREIGVRIALGARQYSVVWLVLRETLALIVIGLALGIPAFLSASRYVESELFGLAPGDPGAVSTAILVLLSVAAAAGYLPARRASRVDPMVALRYE